MPIKRIETTVYFVNDWDSSITFYRDLLGLKPLVVVPRVWAHFVAPGGGRIALQLQPPNGNEPPHVSVDVSDIRSFVDELRARGVEIVQPVTKQDFGDSALIADPSGNIVSLVDLSTSKMPHD
jgi:predicted enzyme related to lactoylglutathione lyase